MSPLLIHPPVLTLVGDAEITVEAGSSYNDGGVTAIDSFEGDLISKIVITGTVDTSKLAPVSPLTSLTPPATRLSK